MFDNKKKKNNEKWVKMVEGFWYGKEKDLKNPEMMYKQKNSKKVLCGDLQYQGIYEQTKTFKIIFVFCKFLK